MQALAPAAVDAARPQRARRAQQHQRRAAPVQQVETFAQQVMAKAVHRRIGQVGPDRVQHQRMIQPRTVEGERRQHPADHDEVGQVFVVDDDLHGDRQHREQREVGQHDREQRLQVQARFELEVPLEQLDQHGRDHGNEQQAGLQPDQRQRLAGQRQPAWHRQRIEDLAGAHLALAPDQFTGIEDGRDDHEETRHIADQFQHHVGDGIGRRPIHRAQVERAGDQREHAGRGQRHEVRVAGRFAQLAPARFDEQHGQAAGREIGRRAGVARRARQGWGEPGGQSGRQFGRQLAARARLAFGLADGLEAPVAKQQHQQREAGPDHAVDQIHVGQCDQARVALGQRPVFGQADQGRGAERVDQRGQRLEIEVARQRRRDRVPERHDHAGHVHRQHAPGEGGQHEEDRAKDEQVGQQREQIRREPGRQRCAAEAIGRDPGQHGAEPQAQHDAGEDHGQRGVRAQEAAEHVVGLAQRRAEKEVVHLVLEILLHRAAHDGGGNDDPEAAEHRRGQRDLTRPVDRDAGAERDRQLAKRAARRHHPQHPERQEAAKIHPGRQQPQALPGLEAGNDEQRAHGQQSPAAGL